VFSSYQRDTIQIFELIGIHDKCHELVL
jgi:hypothetical protein